LADITEDQIASPSDTAFAPQQRQQRTEEVGIRTCRWCGRDIDLRSGDSGCQASGAGVWQSGE
jgi:hypothetical protein